MKPFYGFFSNIHNQSKINPFCHPAMLFSSGYLYLTRVSVFARRLEALHLLYLKTSCTHFPQSTDPSINFRRRPDALVGISPRYAVSGNPSFHYSNLLTSPFESTWSFDRLRMMLSVPPQGPESHQSIKPNFNIIPCFIPALA